MDKRQGTYRLPAGIADDLPALESHPKTSNQVTDHYLADLAAKHGFKLATLDQQIKLKSEGTRFAVNYLLLYFLVAFYLLHQLGIFRAPKIIPIQQSVLKLPSLMWLFIGAPSVSIIGFDIISTNYFIFCWMATKSVRKPDGSL